MRTRDEQLLAIYAEIAKLNYKLEAQIQYNKNQMKKITTCAWMIVVVNFLYLCFS